MKTFIGIYTTVKCCERCTRGIGVESNLNPPNPCSLPSQSSIDTSCIRTLHMPWSCFHRIHIGEYYLYNESSWRKVLCLMLPPRAKRVPRQEVHNFNVPGAKWWVSRPSGRYTLPFWSHCLSALSRWGESGRKKRKMVPPLLSTLRC